MKKKSKKESKFFKIYFIIMIIYAILGLSDNFIISANRESFWEINTLYSIFATIFALGIFILSIKALLVFVKNKFPKITLVIPLYHIISTILIFSLSFIWGVVMSMQGLAIPEQPIHSSLLIIGTITSLFELIFSSYVLYKFK